MRTPCDRLSSCHARSSETSSAISLRSLSMRRSLGLRRPTLSAARQAAAKVIARPSGKTIAGTVAAAPAKRISKRDFVTHIVAGVVVLRRRLLFERRRNRLDQDGFLRLALILELADDELDLFV